MCLACKLASAILSLLTLLPDLLCCTQLDLSGNNIGAEGAKPLADALRVCPSLTALDARYNGLGDDSRALLQDAVKGRAGFDLKL